MRVRMRVSGLTLKLQLRVAKKGGGKKEGLVDDDSLNTYTLYDGMTARL